MATAKKLAAKKAATTQPAPRPKPLKIGTKVRFTRRNGSAVDGRVDGYDDKPNGRWVSVNIAPKGENRVLVNKRQSQLTVI